MRKKRTLRKHRLLRKLLLIVLLLGIGCSAAVLRMRPLFMMYAQNEVQGCVVRAIDAGVESQIYENRSVYQNIVQMEHDTEKRITALRTDVILINRMKTQVVDNIYDAVDLLMEKKLTVPVGSLFAPSWRGGAGPQIPISIAGLGTVQAEFASAFSQAGINQTRHNIVLEVCVPVDIVTPLGSETMQVKTKFFVTDTVIVGTVPDQYVYIEDTDGQLLDKINDYAGSVQ